MDLEALREAVVAGRLEWRRHSLERIMERSISRDYVKKTLLTGEVIEDYPENEPYPSALLLGWLEDKPLHVVAAYDNSSGYGYIVTVYHPDLENFEEDYKTRRDYEKT